MLASAVVEYLNVIDHIVSGFLTRRIILMRSALAFSTAKEPFGHRIVGTFHLTTHAPADSVISQQTLVSVIDILTASIEVLSISV
jgi:hypothetical protein